MSAISHLLFNTDTNFLDEAAESVGAILGYTSWERRQSSNYVGGEYFRAHLLGIELVVAVADNSEYAAYSFSMTISPEPVCAVDQIVVQGISDIVARKLAANGIDVLRPFDRARPGAGARTSFRLTILAHYVEITAQAFSKDYQPALSADTAVAYDRVVRDVVSHMIGGCFRVHRFYHRR